jgi:hypothetical protein
LSDASRRSAQIQQHRRSSPKGRLGATRRKAAFGEQRGLRITHHSADRQRGVQQTVKRGFPKLIRALTDFRQRVNGHPKQIAQILMPVQAVDVKQQRA